MTAATDLLRSAASAMRIEVVRSDAGWFARLIASNGKEIWRTSETYTRRRGAERAIDLMWALGDQTRVEVREKDER